MFNEKKYPTSDENHLGVELEFCCKLYEQQLADQLGDLIQYIQIKTDNSVKPKREGYPYPIEVVACIPQTRLDLVEQMVDIIQPVSVVNYTCGFHVHLDMRNRNPDQCYYNLYCAMPILYAMNPSNRYIGKGTSESGGGFAKKNEYKTINDEYQYKLNNMRYKGINVEALNLHNTLEVRIHSGTINKEKIMNWIEILLHIVDGSMPRILYNVNDFCRVLDLEHLKEYIQQRIRKFNKDGYHLNVEEDN